MASFVSSEHIEYIKSITVEGRGELSTATTRARAKPAAQAKQTALQLRRERDYDEAALAFLGRRLRRRPDREVRDVGEVAADVAVSALVDAPVGASEPVSVDDLQEVAAPARDAPGDFQLTCVRCGEVRDVTFDMHDLWVNSQRRKPTCHHAKYVCR